MKIDALSNDTVTFHQESLAVKIDALSNDTVTFHQEDYTCGGDSSDIKIQRRFLGELGFLHTHAV